MTDARDDQPESIDDLLAAMDEVDTSRPDDTADDEYADDEYSGDEYGDDDGNDGAGDDADDVTSDDADDGAGIDADDDEARADADERSAAGGADDDDADDGAAADDGAIDEVDLAADLGLDLDDLTPAADVTAADVTPGDADAEPAGDDDDDLGLDLSDASESSGDDDDIDAATGEFAEDFDVDAFLAEVSAASDTAEALAAEAVEAEREAAAAAAAEAAAAREAALAAAVGRGDLPDLDAEPAGAAPATPARSAPTIERSETPAQDDGPGITVQFPSNDFPRPPAFRIRIPDDWLAVPVPDAEMAVRAATPIDDFHPNVVVRVLRIPMTASPAETLLRATQAELVKPGVEVLTDEVRTEGPTPARRVLVRYATNEAVWCRARQLVVHVPAAERVSNLVSIVGTWAEASGDEMQAAVDAIVASLQIRP